MNPEYLKNIGIRVNRGDDNLYKAMREAALLQHEARKRKNAATLERLTGNVEVLN
jgi:hypothetical protein